MSLIIKDTHSRRELREIKRLYKKAFPRCERKPFSMIMRMRRAGKCDILHLSDSDGFLGLCITVSGEGIVLIDYFAVNEERRGRGHGSLMMREVIKRYTGWGIFLEIERPMGDGGITDRRLSFYLRQGYLELGVSARLFGIDMILLGINCTLDFDAYREFYCKNIGEFARSHITRI